MTKFYKNILFLSILECEVNFIRLLDKLTNGSSIKIGQTGTDLRYSPGLLFGGEIEHDCSLQRGIGYYLEAVMILAPFCKNPVKIKLNGVTNNNEGKLKIFVF